MRLSSLFVGFVVVSLSLPPDGAAQRVQEVVASPGTSIGEAVGAEAAERSAPTTVLRRPESTGFTSGPNGDLFMDSPAPFTTVGVLLQARSGFPNVFVKLGAANSSASFTVADVNNSEILKVRADGNVGIGGVPTERLQVWGGVNTYGDSRRNLSLIDTTALASGVGSGIDLVGKYNAAGAYAQFANIKGIKENSTDGDSGGAFVISTSSAAGGVPAERVRVDSFGNVGIGTAPATNVRLHIKSNVSYGLAVQDVAGNNLIYARYDGLIYFGRGAVESMRIDPSGNVGIGTPSPTTKLDVNGNINVSGNINAKYQDIAEWVPASGDLPAGTVVVLDPDTPNTVRASGREYDETVAGVISARPGLILGEAGDEKSLVATTGRVKVRVDASFGPIAIGDLLVTSARSGFAMRSQPMDINGRRMHQPGTIIGKALEPLREGKGEILVLLSLQ